MPRMSAEEARFIAALRRRDERAFSRLVLRYQDRVFNLCYRLLGSEEEARDVAQEVFVSIFQKIDRFRGDAKLSTWIYRVATNHAKNRLKYLARRHDRDSTSFDDLAVTPSSGRLSAQVPRPDDAVDELRLEIFIEQQLQALDEDQRTMVVLRDIEGLTYDEIAHVTELAMGTIKSRLHRGRVQLKAALKEWMAGKDRGKVNKLRKRTG